MRIVRVGSNSITRSLSVSRVTNVGRQPHLENLRGYFNFFTSTFELRPL